MKKLFIFIAITAISIVAFAQNNYFWSASKKHYLEEEPGVYIVQFTSKEKTEDIKKNLRSKQDIKYVTSIKDNLGLIISREGIALTTDRLKAYEEIENAMPAYEFGNLPFYLTGEILLQPKSGVSIDKILGIIDNNAKVKRKTKYNTFILETKHWDELMEYSNRIYESGLVKYCHPNFIAPVETTIDPLYSDQYYLNNTGQFGGTAGIDINAPQAWSITTGSSNLRVAVIDDGVETHEELTGSVLQGFTPQFSENHPDTQGEPSTSLPPPQYDERFGHGECCAGIIAASHNSIGVRGIAPNVQIVPVNIFNDWFIDSEEINGNLYYFLNYAEDAQDYADAIDWAYDDGNADVLSNSWAYPTTDPDEIVDADNIIAAIDRARTLGRNGLGSVVVFSSGNYNPHPDCYYCFDGVVFPANVNGVVTVGAVDRNGSISNYSSRGPEMDLVAPSSSGSSNDVRTIDRMGINGYETGNYTTSFGGTSAACPQVSGVIALMLSLNPFLTETQVLTTLQQTATDMGSSGFDNTYGYGRVNAEDAVNDIRLYISGSNLVCTSNSTFTLHNRTPGTTVSWQKSSNLQYVSGQGTDNYTVKTTSSASGAAWVRATVNLSGHDSYTLPDYSSWAGTPQITNKKVDGSYYYPGFQICPGNHYLSVTPVGGDAGTTTWTVPYGITYFVGTNTLDFTFPSNANSVAITARSANSCGTGPNSSFYLTKKTWGCSGYYAMTLTPNPASDNVTITMLESQPLIDYAESGNTTVDVDVKTYEPTTYTINIYNNQSTKLSSVTRSGKSFNVSLINLLDGTYTIEVSDGRNSYRQQLVVKHN
jgi:serine protease